MYVLCFLEQCALFVEECSSCPQASEMKCHNAHPLFSSLYGTHSSERKGDRGKKTSDCARTRDLHSIAEFEPREPRRLVEILRPPSLLCTGHRRPLSSDTEDLRLEAGTVCGVMVAGSAVPSMLHESVSLRWKAASISLYVQCDC